MTGTTITTVATSITTEIERLQAQIDRLIEARNALGTEQATVLATVTEITEAPKVKATRKSTKRAPKGNGNGNRREQIIHLLTTTEMSPREIGDALGIAPTYVYHVKRDLGNTKSAPKATKKATTKKAKATKVTGANRREQIIHLLTTTDLNAKQIGDKLGIAPTYVYHVKRDWTMDQLAA